MWPVGGLGRKGRGGNKRTERGDTRGKTTKGRTQQGWGGEEGEKGMAKRK